MIKLVIFDLDGTLAESKSAIDSEMAALLSRLLEIVKVAVISGGAWPQFEKQLLSYLSANDRLKSLSLLPTCGTKFCRYNGTWNELYSEDFDSEQKIMIIKSLTQALDSSGFRAEQCWGELIEDRGSQITLSVLGQDAPVEKKKIWDPNFEKREKIKTLLEPLIPGFSVHLGGATSIDVTRPGIDKAYGVSKLQTILSIALKDMLFIGDALFPGGNDYPVKQAGVSSIKVRDPMETKCVIEAIIACLSTAD